MNLYLTIPGSLLYLKCVSFFPSDTSMACNSRYASNYNIVAGLLPQRLVCIQTGESRPLHIVTDLFGCVKHARDKVIAAGEI